MMASTSDVSSRRKLFCKDSDPLTFYIIPCKRKKSIQDMVTNHGGRMSINRREAQYQLYNPGDIVSNPKMVSTTFINDCLKEQKLLDIEQYRYSVRASIEKAAAAAEEEFAFEDLSPTLSKQARGKRGEYTVGEDMKIIEAVLKECKHHSVNGNRLWEVIAARQVISRTCQSMKERFIKKILPYIQKYDLSTTEIRKLQRLSSSKSESVTATKGRVHLRSQLDFLKGPRRADVYQLDSSSSSDESLGDNLLVPHIPVNRKRKAPIIELSSNSSGPSSQSEPSQQSQEPRKSKRRAALRHQPLPKSTSRDIELAEVQQKVPGVSQQSSGSSHASGVSYIIENPSPDAAVSSTTLLSDVSPITTSRGRNHQESADMALLGTPRKAGVKLPSVVLHRTATTLPQPAAAAHSPMSSTSRSSGQMPSPITERTQKVMDGSRSTDDNLLSVDAQVKRALAIAESVPCTQPFVISMSNGVDNEVHRYPNSSPEGETQPFTCQDTQTCFGNMPHSNTQEADTIDSLVQKDSRAVVENGSDEMSPLLFAQQSSDENEKSHNASAEQTLSQDSDCSIEVISVQPNKSAPTITESDNLFRNMLMSDSLTSDADVWPCKTPTDTPIRWMDGVKRRSSSIPKTDISQSTQHTQHNQGKEEEIFSWSTFDFENEKSSFESQKSETNKNNSCGKVRFSDDVSPQVDQTKSDSLSGGNSGDLHSTAIPRRSPRRNKSAAIPSVHPDIALPPAPNGSSGHSKSLQSNKTEQASTSSQRSLYSLVTALTCSHRNPKCPGNSVSITETQKQYSKKDDPSVQLANYHSDHLERIVNQSWCDEDLQGSPVIERHMIDCTKPPPLLRKSCLKDVLHQPMREPQYEDANSSFVLTQENADCVTSGDSEMEDSFKTASSHGDYQGESNSSVKVMPLEAMSVTSTSKEVYGDTMSVPSNSKEVDGNTMSIPSTSRGPDGDTMSLPSTSRGPDGDTMSMPSTSRGPDGDTMSIPSTSRGPDGNNQEPPPVALSIKKCPSCLKNPTKTCHINDMKSHHMYSKLLQIYQMEDTLLMAYVCGFSADWELLEQYLKSGGKVGVMWTLKDDQLLTNPSFRRQNTKELRKKFSDREVKTRKSFLLAHVELTPKQRKTLMGML